eukprot:gene31421-37979_t
MEFKKEDDSETYSESTDNPPERADHNTDVLNHLSTMNDSDPNEIQPYSQGTWVPPAGNFVNNPLGVAQRKRHRTEDSADENTLELILGQITSKLNSMSTNEDNQSMLIAAFLEVLGCSSAEGEFYLESSAWDIQTAVSVYLENNPNPLTSFSKPFYPINIKKYVDRDVHIPDLPSEWQARVSGVDGTMYFVHLPTNTRQIQVPPGYADAPVEGMERLDFDGPVTSSSQTPHGSSHHNNNNTHDNTGVSSDSNARHVFGTDSEYLRSQGEMKEDGNHPYRNYG